MSFGNGIKLASGFDLNSSLPLDSRQVADTKAELNALTADQKYVGLKVYVTSVNATYVWDGTEWDSCENKILSASGAPAADAGIIGDWAIDTATSNMYHKELVDTTETWVLKMNLKGIQGITGETGSGFAIKKTFASIADMVAYAGVDLVNNDFVLINTGNANDVDNAKLFVRDTTVTTGDTIGYRYLTDLSGSQGIQGTAASIGVGTVTSGAAGSAPIISNSGTTSNAVFDFVIPKGDKGANGSSINVVSTMPVSYIASQIGDIYIDSGTWDVYKITFNSETEVVSATIQGNIKGAIGATGAAGIDGSSILSVSAIPANETGKDGDWAINILNSDLYKRESGAWILKTNIQGKAGTNGTDGANATIEIGTVVSGDAPAVANAGTATNAVFNFTLQKGKDGTSINAGDAVPTDVSTYKENDLFIKTTDGGLYKLISGVFTLIGNIKGIQGIQGASGTDGIDGKPFTVAKVFASVAEMNAYSGGDVTEGDFVIVNTGNVADEDNAKLYVKGASSYIFITDLSGSQGIQGNAGLAATIQTGTVTTADPGTPAAVTNSGTTNAAILNFTIPQGTAGTNGARGSVIYKVTGAPENTLGTDDDWAIDTLTYDLYHRLVGQNWGASVGNIKGAIGTTGTAGANGAKIYPVAAVPTAETGVDGDWAIDSTTYNLYNKVSGAWSLTCNFKGAAGDTIKYGADYATATTAKLFFKVIV